MMSDKKSQPIYTEGSNTKVKTQFPFVLPKIDISGINVIL